MAEHEGGCLCGGLRYTATDEPVRVTICHCRFCQRTTGTAYFVEPVFKRPHVLLTAGIPKTYQHISEGSGKRLTLHFCATCSVRIFLTFERFPDVMGVYAGTFDDPDWFDRMPDNARYIFLDAAQRGTVIPPGVKTYAQHAYEADGTPVDPVVYEDFHVIGADHQGN